jgi:hypothetical protein
MVDTVRSILGWEQKCCGFTSAPLVGGFRDTPYLGPIRELVCREDSRSIDKRLIVGLAVLFAEFLAPIARQMTPEKF